MWEVKKYTYPMDGCEVLFKGTKEQCDNFYNALPFEEKERSAVTPAGASW
ncbi:MAG: hypothetical protein WAP51_03520 [Candidatus Sungiibacteriota bacterium]